MFSKEAGRLEIAVRRSGAGGEAEDENGREDASGRIECEVR